MVDPILETVFQASLNGLDAFENEDAETVLLCANQLTEAYTAFLDSTAPVQVFRRDFVVW